ncbi:MAG: nucleotidyltransferase family protein [Candidatus Dormibacteraceae bacterium]
MAGKRNSAGVFGSVARGDTSPESDHDIAVELESGMGGFKAFNHLDRLEKALIKLLNRPVDVVTTSHRSAFANRVRKETVPI